MRAETAPAAIVRVLMESISVGGLTPGEKLPSEAELARSYQVAPMTLRRALAGLRELGLVETRRGRFGGTYVREDVADRLREALSGVTVTAEDLIALFEWRRAISCEACALAASRGTPEEFHEMWATSEQFDGLAGELASRRLVDARLHTLIALSARSPHLLREEIEIQEALSKVILSLPNLTSFYVALPHTHDALLSAIGERDAELARAAMTEHAESSLEWCLSLARLQPGEAPG